MREELLDDHIYFRISESDKIRQNSWQIIHKVYPILAKLAQYHE